MVREFLNATYKTARRIAIAIVGMTVLVIGIVMIVLPGPAFIVIPAGLGILSLEFVWARRWLKKVKEKTEQAVNVVRNRNGSKNISMTGGMDGRDLNH